MQLTKRELDVRRLLVLVAQGRLITREPGYISYKELWSRVSKEPWGRARTKIIVGWITRISCSELLAGRPPLNEIVVPANKKEPTEPWSRISGYFNSEFGVAAPFRSHCEAQQACWLYWGVHSSKDEGPAKDVTESQAEEGFKQDRMAPFRKRNSRLIAQRKELDRFRCQACGFRLKVNGTYVIDCHHVNPLGHLDTVIVTRVEDLICLCPTCHRIAHARRYPFVPSEIMTLRSARNVVRKAA
jgi:hypothetical protein